MAPPSHQAPKKRIVGRSTLGSKLGKPRSKGSSAGVGSATQAASSKLKADDDKYSSILAQYAEDKKKRGLAYKEAMDGFHPRKRVKQDRVDDDGGGRVTASGSSKPYRTRSSTAKLPLRRTKTGTSKAKALSSKATDRQWINVGHIAVEVEPELYVKKTRKGKGVVLRPVVKAGDIIKRPDDERLEELRTMGCKVDGEFWISRDMSINHVYKLIRGWVPAVAVIAEAFPDEIPICLGNGTYNRMTLKNDFSGEPILTMLTMNSRATTGKDKRKLVFAVTKELPQAVWDTLRPWEESSETLPVFYNSDGELVENGGESEDGEMFEGFEGSGYSVDVDEADRDEDICGPEADPPLDVEARSVEDRSEGTPPPSSDDEMEDH
ncbi:hypothetical protein FISHEDRAFT_63154 [Fistulina hepatica ATCC 64428]|uniref:Uncharacterized protein n=1 Tax=Fistulina hepatica ATCC 64428 TaxID=1128425 RepID=A0A0D7A076_9AGAR|nr:hypothetical protein FISHEDRAFT_63154 [Fistulina hepatica ATCC 64428]